MADEIIAEEKPTPKQNGQSKIRMGVFIQIIVFIIFVSLLGFGLYKLFRMNVSLAENVAVLHIQVANNQNGITELQKSITDVQQLEKQTDVLKQQQEQMVSEWRAAQKGDLEKWHVAEAQYLVNLANDHLQFSQDTQVAEMLLQRADQIIQSLQNSNLNALHQALTANIAAVQALPKVDITKLYSSLISLNKQIAQLPLPSYPLKPNTEKTEAQPEAQWWQRGLHNAWQSLQQIVIVRKTDAKAMPLILPDEKNFLYQNLHAQIENAIWGLLHRNVTVYQTSLEQAHAWIEHYFLQDAPVTKTMLQNLQELRNTNIQVTSNNFSATLQLFDQYFAEAKQEQKAQ